MPLRRSQLDANIVGPEKLSASVRQHRYCFETFMNEPFCSVKGANAAPGGTSGTENLVNTGRYTFEYYFVGGASDGFYPLIGTAGGYDWKLDNDTVAEGVEINFGSLFTGHPRTYTSTSEDWFARLLFITDDASGLDLFFGGRKVAAYAQTLTEYSDLVGLRVLGDSSSTTGAITIVTNLNNAGATDYSSATATGATPLEDATAIELELRSIGGQGFLFVNGAQVTGATYTFDSGDVFTPICRILHSTDLAGVTKTLAFECGLLADRDPNSLVSLAGATA